jgi:hypothetical protein
MKRLLIPSLVLAAVIVALLPTPGVAARSCGHGVTVSGDVPCYKARSIVNEWKKTRKTHIQGYKCSGTVSGGRVTAVKCRLQDKTIRWKA